MEKKKERTKGRKRRAQVLGFNTLNFCLLVFFPSFLLLRAFSSFRLCFCCCAQHTFERAIESFKRKLSVMTQQQRTEGDVGAIALIRVPIGDSGEHVSIDPHNLPQTDVEDILGVLQSELAPLRVWLECAKAYLAEDNEEAFLEIVGSGCSPGERERF